MDAKRDGPAPKRRRLEDRQNLILPRRHRNPGHQLNQQDSYRPILQQHPSRDPGAVNCLGPASNLIAGNLETTACTNSLNVPAASPWRDIHSDPTISGYPRTALPWQRDHYLLPDQPSWNVDESDSMEILSGFPHGGTIHHHTTMMIPGLHYQNLHVPSFSTRSEVSFDSNDTRPMTYDTYTERCPIEAIDDGSTDQMLSQDSSNTTQCHEEVGRTKEIVCFGTVCHHQPYSVNTVCIVHG